MATLLTDIVAPSGVVDLNTAQTLTNKTLTSPVLNGSVDINGLLYPSTDGLNQQMLMTDGNGQLYWGNVTVGATTQITMGNSSISISDSGIGTITTVVDGTTVRVDNATGTELSGTPTAPTAPAGTTTTQIATTEFAVQEALNRAMAMAIALG